MKCDRAAEWRIHAANALKNKICPDSGLPLTDHGNVRVPAGTMSCPVCDCFGYDPQDIGEHDHGW